jgi:predicted dehydrogenase
MKFAVLGSAHEHIYEFIEDMLGREHEFVGIYNDDSVLVKEIAQKYDVAVYQQLEELFDKGIEVAGTSAINNQKMRYIAECNKHGVHIIADKPLVLNRSQYQELEAIIKEGRIEIGLMLTARFMPQVYSIKKLITKGAIGDLISIEIFNPHQLKVNKRPEWHFEREQNGGVVIDLMIHSIDLYNWFTESLIEDYYGVAQKTILPDKESFYDSTQFFVIGKNGITGYFRADWHMTDTHWSWGDFRVFCSGTKGCLEARVLGDPLTKEPMLILFEEGKETRKLSVDDPGLSVTGDFINRVEGRDYIIGHKDILDASRMSIEFDEKAKEINKFKK